jgi:AcrR family transcriptional regulator
MPSQPVNSRRRYDNRHREEQARQTRRRILQAAREVLLGRGYTAMTIAAVAEAAGVSAETVYKRFGTKAALVKEVYDVTLAGDDLPIPIPARGSWRDLLEDPSPRGKVARYAAHARQISERIAPLLDVLLAGSRAGDPDLQAFAEKIHAERLTGTTLFVTHLAESGSLRPGLDPARARDAVWVLNSPEVHRLLVTDRGWGSDDYQDWLAETISRTILR